MMLGYYLLPATSRLCLWCLLKAIVDNKHNSPVMNWVRQEGLIERSALKSDSTKHLFFLFFPFSLWICGCVQSFNELHLWPGFYVSQDVMSWKSRKRLKRRHDLTLRGTIPNAGLGAREVMIPPYRRHCKCIVHIPGVNQEQHGDAGGSSSSSSRTGRPEMCIETRKH